MVLVDSSVWVDYFNGRPSPAADHLDRLLESEPVATGDLILTEVLRGFRHDRDYNQARLLFGRLTVFGLAGMPRSVRAADHFRWLRRRGITIRSGNDVMIATFCLDAGLPLLYGDRDFDPFVRHLGLVPALRNGNSE